MQKIYSSFFVNECFQSVSLELGTCVIVRHFAVQNCLPVRRVLTFEAEWRMTRYKGGKTPLCRMLYCGKKTCVDVDALRKQSTRVQFCPFPNEQHNHVNKQTWWTLLLTSYTMKRQMII